MKRVLSVVGARPNFMKVAPIHRAFQAYTDTVEHHIVHTGQHYDAAMSDAFFNDLDMPQPTWFLGVGSGSHAEQTARVMTGFESICIDERPDYVIVVGDVNSTIACALTAVKCGIRVAHVEAGLRSFDRSMPEEINRLATDAIADDLFVTEESGRKHLLHEGVAGDRIHFVGNTMIDSLHYALPGARASAIHARIGVTPGSYALITLHRPSNVDDPAQLRMLLDVLDTVARDVAVVFPVHPRTRKNIVQWGLDKGLHENVKFIDPAGYVDFLALMMQCRFVLTDSGGIQEETTALGIPCITARTTTERPVTVDVGTNILVNPDRISIEGVVARILAGDVRKGRVPELWDGRAADRIAAIITTQCL
ncbi:MAG: UDP-N-acetylglucosamine 2-epimerase (non-hydrolyzing) ['Candidatus Kapabacteria' thiocyanatum]|uniref:UDP-N-acetylglucosamine 2-epimerase n=1 Tax=Candidatus Kapaibacterium thiocyanatum TaxID=1895771 RepID=A0A1M3KXW8_9BACT|nr:UDP-N-acetylglucosamine 2-epimerase (non-hydrolyzing) ['Candidatus Kapabacteria' thiocyanatum]OJX57237.1 MAG: UDP-N-acetylglucosamine 2-epimerase ['Candidatus Kapabacteria' thiocyanatum]